MKMFYIKKIKSIRALKNNKLCLNKYFFNKVENIRTHFPLRAMFFILKHVDKENSEYLEHVKYTDLTKQKKIFHDIARGAVSRHRINNFDL